MERDFYTDEFEQLIKEKSDQFRMYPSKRVWHSIYNNLHPSRRWPSFAISILFLTSLPLIGYLNTGNDAAKEPFTGGKPGSSLAGKSNSIAKNDESALAGKPLPENNNSTYLYSSNKPEINTEATPPNTKLSQSSYVAGTSRRSPVTNKPAAGKNNNKGLVQPAGNPVNNSQQLFAVTEAATKKNNLKETNPANPQAGNEAISAENDDALNKAESKINMAVQSPAPETTVAEKEKANAQKAIIAEAKADPQEEKSWIENYAMQNKPKSSKWKDRLDIEFYATPAVNYRKLTTDSKGSVAPFATTGDINKSISQKPGLGIETGLGVSYAFAKNLRFKAGVQFNYTNYNINADQINHPIQTSILLTDPVTGYSYPAARSSSIANTFDNNALQPVTLHNRTYQVSMPIGLSYKLSSNKNVEWFIGATAQPSYIFGGKAHLISSDLKNYVSDPSSIRTWNLNIGLETYMNYRLGAYSLRVGPQVRYQVYSTYRKDIALIEKPYAVGLKFGIVKGF